MMQKPHRDVVALLLLGHCRGNCITLSIGQLFTLTACLTITKVCLNTFALVYYGVFNLHKCTRYIHMYLGRYVEGIMYVCQLLLISYKAGWMKNKNIMKIFMKSTEQVVRY
jgi:hypothetical protein